jgi:hypothetical protein
MSICADLGGNACHEWANDELFPGYWATMGNLPSEEGELQPISFGAALAKAEANGLGKILGCRGNSFAPGTDVLMADGTTRPIEQVQIGDEVTATDPATGTTTAEPVTALHLNQDTNFVDLTVHNATGSTTAIHTTQHHPFWDDTRDAWTDAVGLRPGDKLHTTNGDEATVTAVRSFTGLHPMYNLTINHIHTYYVLAGGTPVLVHNTCIEEDAFRIGQHVNPRHMPGGALNAGKSMFNQGEDLLELAQRTTSHIGKRQADTGRIEYVIDAGRVIGKDANGVDASVYTVIRTGGREVYDNDFLEFGDLVTMHPGVP